MAEGAPPPPSLISDSPPLRAVRRRRTLPRRSQQASFPRAPRPVPARRGARDQLARPHNGPKRRRRLRRQRYGPGDRDPPRRSAHGDRGRGPERGRLGVLPSKGPRRGGREAVLDAEATKEGITRAAAWVRRRADQTCDTRTVLVAAKDDQYAGPQGAGRSGDAAELCRHDRRRNGPLPPRYNARMQMRSLRSKSARTGRSRAAPRRPKTAPSSTRPQPHPSPSLHPSS